MVKLLGLDPGLRITGWGIIESNGSRISHIAHGVVKSQEDALLPNRLDQLYQQLLDVIRQFQPEEAAVEEVFMNSNPASTLKLGMARGIVLLAPVQFGLKVSEYSANRVKKSVVGVGHADKTQVESMVRLLLPTAGNVTKDAADALAVAICHAHFRTASYHIGMS